jgi:phage shock protein A
MTQSPLIPQQQPADIDALLAIIQEDFPRAGIMITGRARTIRRQAELMAERILADRAEFLRTYRRAQHITEMDQFCRQRPGATLEETVEEFVLIIERARARGAIERARARGATVSNHLSDSARDISWPAGTPAELDAVEGRIRELGAKVLREPEAAGGRHWHVDW